MVGSPFSRDVADIDLCDFSVRKPYLLKLTAISEAGSTTVLYRIQLNGELERRCRFSFYYFIGSHGIR